MLDRDTDSSSVLALLTLCKQVFEGLEIQGALETEIDVELVSGSSNSLVASLRQAFKDSSWKTKLIRSRVHVTIVA